MADDKTKRGGNDRAQVAGGEPYEIDYFARKHGLTREQAQALIDRVGNDRAALDEAAEQQTGSTTPKPRRSRKAASTSAANEGAGSTPGRKKPGPKKAAAATAASAAIQPVVTVADDVAETIIEPVAKIVRPAARRAIDKTGKAATATRRSAARITRKVAVMPAVLSEEAGNAADTVKSAASSRAATMIGAAAAGLVTGFALHLGRKAAVQAPSMLAGDWLEAVKLEHKMALALFDKLQATRDDEAGKRSVLLTQLKHALGKHAFTEENVLYPALRAYGAVTDADKLNHDHGYVKQYLYDLEQLDNRSAAYLPKVAEFRAKIEEHINEEEESIFPPLHAALGDVGNARVTALANKEGFKLA